MKLDTNIKGLFFDIYATLIDWEAGILPFLLHLSQQPSSSENGHKDAQASRAFLLQAYHEHQKVVWEEHPTHKYPQILEEAYARLALDLGVKYSREDQVAFGKSIGEWPAFPDTVKAMQALSKHYKLFVLSNVDNESFKRTCAGPLNGVHWDGIYTAEMIGSYKPNPNNYNFVAERAAEDFSIPKEELILVAQSLEIDHVMTKSLGFKPGIWISRQGASLDSNRDEMEQKGLIELGAAYNTLGEMAEAVEKAFSQS